MKNKTKKRISLFLIFVLLLSLSIIPVSSAQVNRRDIELDDAGISYTNAGTVSTYSIQQDENLIGQISRQLVTVVFDLFIEVRLGGQSEDVNYDVYFSDLVEKYNSGLISPTDALRIGYPDFIDYNSLKIDYMGEVYFTYSEYPDDFDFFNNINLRDIEYGNWSPSSGVRDCYFNRYRVTATYYQSASIPSYRSTIGFLSYTNSLYASVADQVYIGDGGTFSNFLIWSPYLWDKDVVINYRLLPVSISVGFGLPKVSSWVGCQNNMSVYTCCTYFDIYTGFMKYGLEQTDTKYSKYTQTINLVNDFCAFYDPTSGDPREVGMGWFDPYQFISAGSPIGNAGYPFVFYGIDVQKTEFTPGADVEYWPSSVTFSLGFDFDTVNLREIGLFYCTMSKDYYDRQTLIYDYGADPEKYDITPLVAMRPYIGAWVSLDQTDSVNLTYDGSQASDVDLSKYYKDISFDMPKFDSELSLGENLGAFFKGFIMAFVTLVSSLVNNAVVWFFCESPLLSSVTRPLFVMATTASNMLTDYLVPLLGALGVLAPVVAVGFIISFVRRNK